MAADDAVDLFRSLPDRGDALADARAMRSLALVASGRPGDALAEAEQVAAAIRGRHRPGRRAKRVLVTAHRHAARALAALSRPQDALVQWREAVARFYRLSLPQRLMWMPQGIALRAHLAEALLHAGDAAAAAEQARRVDGWVTVLDNPYSRSYRPLVARHKLMLALSAAQAGDHQRAAEAAAEAVERYRPLAAGHPARAHGLALALDCHAEMRQALQRDDPVAPARECLEVATRLAAEHPDRYGSLRGWALGRLSDRLWAAGEQDEAVRATEQAMHLSRQLDPDERDDAHTVRLWNVLAGRLVMTGAHERALREARGAVDHARTLAATDSGHRDVLRASLATLDTVLARSGRDAEALDTALERLLITRELGCEQPGRYGDELAQEVGAVGGRLCRSGREAEAAELAERTLALVRDAVDPATARLPLARAETAVATTLENAERCPRAVEVGTEALSHWRELARSDPAHRPGLAHALHARSLAYDKLGDLDAALHDIDGAIESVRALVAGTGDGDTHTLTLLVWLSERGRLLVRLGRDGEAVAAVREVAERARDAADEDLQELARKFLARVHDAAPERVAAAWQEATGEPWPPAVG